MGTMIQQYKLTEADYRGERFKDWKSDVKGNNDLLSLTQPDIIKEIHKQYLEAGADIIETNTFSSTAIAKADYNMQSLAYELNVASAKIARQAIEEFTTVNRQPSTVNHTPSTPLRFASGGEAISPKFIAGAIGPMNKTLSLSPDVNNPGFRSVSFDEVSDAYYEQVKGLVEGGVDLLLIETIFDTLNAKAAIFAIKKYFRNIKKPELPVMIEELSKLASCYTSAYPNAGLPNSMGAYEEEPEETAHFLEEWAKEGFVNIVGGCCGTTPEHIKHIAEKVKRFEPRKLPEVETAA